MLWDYWSSVVHLLYLNVVIWKKLSHPDSKCHQSTQFAMQDCTEYCVILKTLFQYRVLHIYMQLFILKNFWESLYVLNEIVTRPPGTGA